MNLIKVMWCRFEQCWRTFIILLVEGSFQTDLFRYLSNYVFRIRNFGNTKAMRVIFGFKTSKISPRFENCRNKFRKSFFVSRDNWIWIGIVKLSLLRTGFFLSVANVLTSRTKIWRVSKRDVFEQSFLDSEQWIW